MADNERQGRTAIRSMFFSVSAALAVVALLEVLGGGSLRAQDSPGGRDLADLYEQSIHDSAVKRPSFRKTLTPIDASRPTVTVITLTRKADQPVRPDHPFRRGKGALALSLRPSAEGVLLADTWVSLPKELGPQCRGKPDARLALQMILGMPPQDGQWELVQFDVAPKHVFRPCASGPDITTTSCSFRLPTAFASAADRQAYLKTQQFVFEQIWSSFISGFPEPGYPFTGMGWTYNWDPASQDHVGISEYVVRKGSPVTSVKTVSPTAFCGTSN